MEDIIFGKQYKLGINMLNANVGHAPTLDTNALGQYHRVSNRFYMYFYRGIKYWADSL